MGKPPVPPSQKRPPRGFALIEMLAVIGLTGLMITLCVLTIQGLLTADRSTRAEWAEMAGLERLAASFRKDVHLARKAPEIDAPSRVSIDQGDGQSVEYRLIEGKVVVTRTRPDFETPAIETHKVQKWRAERVEREDLAGSSLVRLVFRPVARAGIVALPIEAVVPSEVQP